MFQGLDESQFAGAVEALLFVTDEPVGVITLADMLEVDPKLVEETLVDLRERFEREGRGIQLREVAGGWRLYTHPAYHELVERYVLSWDTRKLSQAAMETLAIVAYLQPVTRAGVASVRGVNSDSSINSLVEKGLVREAGQADAPGNPTLYATTRGFLEKFGLRSVRDLPDLDQYAPDDATRELIRERLSASSENVYVAPAAQWSKSGRSRTERRPMAKMTTRLPMCASISMTKAMPASFPAGKLALLARPLNKRLQMRWLQALDWSIRLTSII